MTVPDEAEKQILRELGMVTKDYGIMRRMENMVGLLCYATRDYIWIKNGPPAADETPRRPDDTEIKILQENGIKPGSFTVTYRAADIIQLKFGNTKIYVEIWKGDRKW